MDQDQRHKCKFCRKTFPCGRSLGGHMRSHLALMEEEKMGKGFQGFGGSSNGYGLRENPKKTWRLSNYSNDEKEKQCIKCGKEFQSWKALFGHMRCHSEKRRVSEVEKEEEEEGSWSGGAYNEGVPILKRKRRPRRPASSSSSVSEYEKEQEDVAISLMLLSRDVGYWGNGVSGFNPATESSDKNSVVLEDRDEFEFKKPKGYGSDAELYLENESDGESRKGSGSSFSKKRRTRLDDDEGFDGYGAKLGKSRFECTTCNKSFHSYQALGGHRASHKRMKGLCFGDSSLETDASIDQMEKVKGSHQCEICGKVFASGQALGGHKRSHFVVSSIAAEEEEVKVEEEAMVMSDLLDLNLTASIDEGSSNGKGIAVDAHMVFDTWWAGSNLKSEAMVGMVTNR